MVGKDISGEFQRADAVLIPDKDCKKCQAVNCKVTFSMTNRRHHCRFCGGVFCDACCPELPLPNGSPLTRKNLSKARKCNWCRLPPVLKAYRHTKEGQMEGRPINTILSFLEDRSINALLQSCTALHRTFHVRDVPYYENVNARFPHLRAEAQVGKGGCGTVFKIEDRDHGGRRIAVKTVAKKSIYSYALWKRLFAEIAILKENDHPNVAGLLEVFQTKYELVLVMECGEGGTLSKALEVMRTRRLPMEPFVGHVIGQIAQALKYLFSRNIVHRDIKHENIVLSADFSRVMLIDFGLAEIIKPDSKQSFVPCGTMGFASPENILAVVERKQRFFATGNTMLEADIFSLGVVAYMLLANQKPLRGTRFAEQHAEVKRGLRCTGHRWTTISRETKSVVEHMLLTGTDIRATADDIINSDLVKSSAESVKPIVEEIRKGIEAFEKVIDVEYVMVNAESEWALLDNEGQDGECFITREKSHTSGTSEGRNQLPAGDDSDSTQEEKSHDD